MRLMKTLAGEEIDLDVENDASQCGAFFLGAKTCFSIILKKIVLNGIITKIKGVIF